MSIIQRKSYKAPGHLEIYVCEEKRKKESEEGQGDKRCDEELIHIIIETEKFLDQFFVSWTPWKTGWNILV